MPVLDEYKLIFIPVAKNASTSIHLSLSEVTEVRLSRFSHPPWWVYKQEFPDEWDNYKKFAVVRNPWDRLYSAYRYAKTAHSFYHSSGEPVAYNGFNSGHKPVPHPDEERLRGKTFKECLKVCDAGGMVQQGWYPQSPYIYDDEDNLLVDHLLRMETLDEDFKGLCKTYGIPVREFMHLNRSDGDTSYREHYDNEDRNLATTLYGRDVALLKYTF